MIMKDFVCGLLLGIGSFIIGRILGSWEITLGILLISLGIIISRN